MNVVTNPVATPAIVPAGDAGLNGDLGSGLSYIDVVIVDVVLVVSRRSPPKYVGPLSDGDQRAVQWRSGTRLAASGPT